MEKPTLNRPIRPGWDEEFIQDGQRLTPYALAGRIVRGFGFIRQQDMEEVLHDYVVKNPDLECFSDRSKFSTWLYSCLFHFSADYSRKHYHLRYKNPPVFEPIDEPQEGGKQKQLEQKEDQYHPLEFILSRVFWKSLAD